MTGPPAPEAAISLLLSETMALEMSGYLTQNVPPNPQQVSALGISWIFTPSDCKSARG